MAAEYPLRGCVYRVRLPGEPGRKLRPALVVSPDVRNRLASDVIVLPVSSVLRPAPTHVRLRKGEAGLSKASVIKAEQITTVRKELLDRAPLGGPLSGVRMIEVEKSVLRAIGLPVE